MAAKQRTRQLFPKKINVFIFRFKTFPKNNAVTQKRSNSLDNSDLTK